jgi:hypothetical protein
MVMTKMDRLLTTPLRNVNTLCEWWEAQACGLNKKGIPNLELMCHACMVDVVEGTNERCFQ